MSRFIWTERGREDLRVGDYRVRFEMVQEDTYRILRAGHRRDAYRS